MKEVNQPYKVISKETKKSGYEDKMYDQYSLELKNETYTTLDGLEFQIKTIGYVSVPDGEELDFDNSYHDFYYIQNYIMDENGKQLEFIPGRTGLGGIYNPSASILKAKKWLDKNGEKLMAGKGYQHKSS